MLSDSKYNIMLCSHTSIAIDRAMVHTSTSTKDVYMESGCDGQTFQAAGRCKELEGQHDAYVSFFVPVLMCFVKATSCWCPGQGTCPLQSPPPL